MKQVAIPAKPISPETADAFFAQVEGLEMDVVRLAQRHARTYRRIAWTSLGLLALSLFAIGSLAPIHTVEWRLIRVNETGPVDVVTTLDQAGKVVTDPNIRHALREYVRMRESFYDPEKLYNFRVVSLMSDPAEKLRYTDAVRGSNPASPQSLFRGGYVRVQIESTALLAKGLAQVAFVREEHTDQSGAGQSTRWLATIGYSVNIAAKMKDADRNDNPLGLQVISYHIDQVTK